MLADLPEQWSFMTPWCTMMQSTLETKVSCKATIWRCSHAEGPRVQISLMTYLGECAQVAGRTERRRVLRESLALFAAVGWVDAEVLVQMVLSMMSVQSKTWKQDLALGERPAVLEIKLTDEESTYHGDDLVSFEENLVKLCRRMDSQNSSQEFQQAWKAIVNLASRKATGLPVRGRRSIPTNMSLGLEIPIRLVISRPECRETSGVEGSRAWNIIRNALDAAQFQWGLASDNAATCVKGHSRDFYCALVVDSIRVNSDPNALRYTMRDRRGAREIDADFMQLLNSMSGHARFSTLGFHLSPQWNLHEIWRLIAGLFCASPCSSELEGKQKIVNCVRVTIDRTIGLEFQALCAALAIGSCISVHFIFGACQLDRTACQWLAYGLFSKRARSRSAVKRIKLELIELSVEDTEAIARVLTSENPAQELFKSSNGQQDIVICPDEREFHVHERAKVQASRRCSSNVVSWEATDVFLNRDVSGVKIVGSDDGQSEWVDALVPGIGLCRLQRASLTQCEHAAPIQPQTNLQLHLSVTSSWQGLPRLLELVGLYFQALWINIPNLEVSDVSWIVSSCPNLEVLDIYSQPVAAEPFVRVCERSRTRLRHLECDFDETHLVAAALANSASSLAQHLRWWQLGINTFSFAVRNRDLQSLQKMLDINRTLQYLTIFVTGWSQLEEGFKKYNLQPLDIKGEELPIRCKAAFLSIFQNRSTDSQGTRRSRRRIRTSLQLHAPATCVTMNIFEFAAARAVRRVKVLRK